ncbi:MAG: hypothetical protein QME05_00880 [Candidatus Margulisbacteria bacterium]|nr:hypothetical protein [Candidatus Margulisiibacteriota bacterium]
MGNVLFLILSAFVFPIFVAFLTTYFVNSLWKYPILRIDNYKIKQTANKQIPVEFIIKNFGDSPVMAYWIFCEGKLLENGHFIDRRSGLINPTIEFPLFISDNSSPIGLLSNIEEKEIQIIYCDGFPIHHNYYKTIQKIELGDFDRNIENCKVNIVDEPIDIDIAKRVGFWEKSSSKDFKIINNDQ